MSIGRTFFSAALLPEGVLNPATGQFSVVPGKRNNPRSAAAAVSLLAGRAMIVGGHHCSHRCRESFTDPTNTVDFFDPKSGTFTPAVTMLTPRDFFITALLKSGKMLIPSGRVIVPTGIGIAILETAEIYTP